MIGDGEAQFRINGGTISSAGLEVVSNYKTGLGTGMLDLTLAATFRKNKFEEATVPELNTNLSDEEIAAKYVQRGSVAQFETGTPSTRIIGTVNYKIGKFNFLNSSKLESAQKSWQTEISQLDPISDIAVTAILASTLINELSAPPISRFVLARGAYTRD